MVPLKRRKATASGTGSTGTDRSGAGAPNRFPQFVVFLLERKMGASRRAFLSQLGRKKGFQVEEVFSESVTHVISENNCGEEVRAWLDSQVRGHGHTPAHLLDISWYTESIGAGHPVEVLDRHKLQEPGLIKEVEAVSFSVPSYSCQRRTSLNNHNAVLTDALSLLADYAELSEDPGRGVAFCRAAAVLKALPGPVTDMTQLRGLPCLGEHSLRVIKDILEDGTSAEVESTRQSERYRALKALTGIFGVGAKTADRWIRDGIRDLRQLRESGRTLNRAQRAGWTPALRRPQPAGHEGGGGRCRRDRGESLGVGVTGSKDESDRRIQEGEADGTRRGLPDHSPGGGPRGGADSQSGFLAGVAGFPAVPENLQKLLPGAAGRSCTALLHHGPLREVLLHLPAVRGGQMDGKRRESDPWQRTEPPCFRSGEAVESCEGRSGRRSRRPVCFRSVGLDRIQAV